MSTDLSKDASNFMYSITLVSKTKWTFKIILQTYAFLIIGLLLTLITTIIWMYIPVCLLRLALINIFMLLRGHLFQMSFKFKLFWIFYKLILDVIIKKNYRLLIFINVRRNVLIWKRKKISNKCLNSCFSLLSRIDFSWIVFIVH